MKFFGRSIALNQVPQKIATIVNVVIAVYKWCNNPLSVLKAYFTRKGIDCIKLKNGYKIFLSSSKHDISTFIVIFCKKEYGIWNDKKTVVDVGANIGIFSMYAFCCGAEKVYGFEPNKESFATIQKNIEANNLGDRWIVSNAGIGAVSGSVIYIPKKSSPGNVARKDAGNNQQMFDAMPTISLEDYIAEHKLDKIDLLKVDCEGGEYEMLPSLSSESAASIKSIMLEFHGSETPIRDWFKQNNFSITRYWPSPDEKNLGYLWAANNVSAV